MSEITWQERYKNNEEDKEIAMTISFTQVLIWIIIAAVIGVVGELIARRRAPDGIVGSCAGSLILRTDEIPGKRAGLYSSCFSDTRFPSANLRKSQNMVEIARGVARALAGRQMWVHRSLSAVVSI